MLIGADKEFFVMEFERHKFVRSVYLIKHCLVNQKHK